MGESNSYSEQAGLLTLGLYPSSGGPAKSISAFQNALNAKVISWVDPKHTADEKVIWDTCTTVRGRKSPILNQLLVPNPVDLRDAEAVIAEAELLSVHSFWRWHVVWAMNVCKKYNKPYWFVPHGSLDPYVFETEGRVKRFFLSSVGRKFVENAAGIVFSTERERQKAAQFVPTHNSRVIHWPLEENDFQQRNLEARSLVRTRHGIPENAFCFLYLGRLASMKRPLETIEAFAGVEGSSAHLIIVGNEFGVTVDDCQNKAAALSVSDRVHVVGPAYGDEKLKYMAASDAYVSLSKRENFNFTAAEALATDLPLVLSPGNDLAVELQHLDGVSALNTDALDEATQAMWSFVNAENFQPGIRRAFAQKQFSKASFKQQVLAYGAEVKAQWGKI